MVKLLRPVCLTVVLALVMSLGLTLFVASPVGAAGGPDTFGYRYLCSDDPSGPDYNWIEISGTGTNTGLTGDDVSTEVPIGFQFPFYGNSYSSAWISSNGFITFNSSGAWYYTNYGIPDSNVPNNMIAPLWDDLYIYPPEAVFYETRGVAPNRQFIVEWYVEGYSSSPSDVRFEAILFESTGNILFQYQDVDFGNYRDAGAQGTVGIENSDGTDGLEYSYNIPSLYSGLAILFYLHLEAPHAAFSADIEMGDAPLTVKFRNLSTGDIDYGTFTYGDGSSYGEQGPWVTLIHTFENEGIYNVCLMVSGPGGQDSYCRTIVVEEQAGAPMLSVTNLNVLPVYAQPRQEILITADVTNSGTAWGAETVDLNINGMREQSADVGVAPGTSQPIRFTVYKTTPGTYQVEIGGATGTLYIMQPPPTPAPPTPSSRKSL